VGHITGSVAEENDNDPVEVRGDQILGSALDTSLGYPPTSPIYHRGGFTYDNKYWRYYPNGMIASSENTCAQVLYGPIYEFYDGIGQFDGALGFPTTDVATLPDGTSYAAFENGALWLNASNQVQEVLPLPPGMVKAFSGGLDPSVAGITQFAQTKVQELVTTALASQGAQDKATVTATLAFDSVGQGACIGAGFSSVGTSLPRSHTFRVHVEASLNGCWGILGNIASADLHVTVRLRLQGSTVSGFLEGYTIDGVSTPAGAFDEELRSQLRQALDGEYGQDLINQQVPSGVQVLAVSVDQHGNVLICIEPLCTMSTLSAQVEGSLRGETLARLRAFRDELFADSSIAPQFAQIVDVFGPLFINLLHAQPDGQELGGQVAKMLVGAAQDPDREGLKREVITTAEQLVEAEEHAREHRDYVPLVLGRAIRQLRRAAAQGQDLAAALSEAPSVFERHRRDDDEDRDD
jgi:hypothetical protein